MSETLRLRRSDPESQGLSSGAILDFLEGADERLDSLNAFMLLRHGAVVAEGAWKPYCLDSPHMLFSLSKSFTSTAIGLAVEEGRLSVDDAVLSFFPRKVPKRPSANLRAMRVRHLLSMNTGHEEDTTDRIMRHRDPVKAFLSLPVEREPGSHFVYDSGASFVLSAIAQELTGERLSAYLEPRIFQPLGIEGARWERHPCGIEFGGWGLNIRVEDIARFGQLYLDKGLWKGKRLLGEAWIAQATSRQSENGVPEDPDGISDWHQGYGYQFWRCRHGFYRGDGAFGQLCVVMEEEDVVLAVTAGIPDIQAALTLAWDRLLPGISKDPLPPDPATVSRLRDFSSALRLRPPAAGTGAAAEAAVLSGSLAGRSFRFADNWAGLDEARFDFGGDRMEMTYRITRRKAVRAGLADSKDPPRGSGRRKLACGHGEWLEGVSYLEGEGPRKAACAGAWTSPGVFTVKHVSTETPFATALTFRFEGDRVRVEVKRNVGFGPTELPPIEGRAGR